MTDTAYVLMVQHCTAAGRSHTEFYGPYPSLSAAEWDADRLYNAYTAEPFRLDGQPCKTAFSTNSLNGPLS